MNCDLYHSNWVDRRLFIMPFSPDGTPPSPRQRAILAGNPGRGGRGYLLLIAICGDERSTAILGSVAAYPLLCSEEAPNAPTIRRSSVPSPASAHSSRLSGHFGAPTSSWARSTVTKPENKSVSQPEPWCSRLNCDLYHCNASSCKHEQYRLFYCQAIIKGAAFMHRRRRSFFITTAHLQRSCWSDRATFWPDRARLPKL